MIILKAYNFIIMYFHIIKEIVNIILYATNKWIAGWLGYFSSITSPPVKVLVERSSSAGPL